MSPSLRTSFCSLLALVIVVLAAVMAAGLDRGPLHQLVASLSWSISALSFGGVAPAFLAPATVELRRGVVGPATAASLAVLALFAASTWAMVTGSPRAIFVDCATVLAALGLSLLATRANAVAGGVGCRPVSS